MPLANAAIYDTNSVIGVVDNLLIAQTFLADMFFPAVVNADTEFVSIDVDIGKRRMSPFVSPLVEGRLVESRRYQTNTFAPPYIKDKRAPDLRKPVRRMMGERIGGELTPQQRRDMNMQLELADQIDMINRRLEWMAAQILQGGTVTVSGDGFPTTLIDYGRDSSLTIAKSAGTKWTTANISGGAAVPTDDLDTWSQSILKASGAVVTDVVFTNSPFTQFKKDPVLNQARWYPGEGGAGNDIQLGTTTDRGAVYKGRWGNYRLWLYNDWYVDSSNVQQPMLPDGTVLLAGPMMQGTRAFAAIKDPAIGYIPASYAAKTWIQQDPAQEFLMLQSSPLLIPGRPNASLAATVL